VDQVTVLQCQQNGVDNRVTATRVSLVLCRMQVVKKEQLATWTRLDSAASYRGGLLAGHAWLDN
jgi:hypothetical protein